MSTSMATRPTGAPVLAGTAGGFLLRFDCLFTGRGLSFPCDASGAVDLAGLSQRARDNLDRALSGVGRDFGVPQVVPAY